MAQTTSSGRKSSSSTRSRTAQRRNAAGNSGARRTQTSSGKARTNTSVASKRSSRRSSNNAGRVESVRRSMTAGPNKVSDTAKNSKTPMIAGGAALAGLAGGLAGGLALGARRVGKRKILGIGVSVPRRSGSAATKVAATARQLGVASQRL